MNPEQQRLDERAMHLFATMTPQQALKGGKTSYFETQGVQPAN